MEFSELVRRRRMVRHFAPDPIDRDVLERIAAIAQRAPSAGFSQGQRLLIVTDAETRRRIARLCGEEEMAAVGYDPWLSEAPAHLIACVSEAATTDVTASRTSSRTTAPRSSGRSRTGGWTSVRR